MLKHSTQQDSRNSWVFENVWPTVTWSLDNRENENDHFFLVDFLPKIYIAISVREDWLQKFIWGWGGAKMKNDINNSSGNTPVLVFLPGGIENGLKKVLGWWYQWEGASRGGIPSTEHNSTKCAVYKMDSWEGSH